MIVTKNNESATESNASELGLPTASGAAMANVDAKLQKNVERAKRLGTLSSKIENEGALGGLRVRKQEEF